MSSAVVGNEEDGEEIKRGVECQGEEYELIAGIWESVESCRKGQPSQVCFRKVPRGAPGWLS